MKKRWKPLFNTRKISTLVGLCFFVIQWVSAQLVTDYPTRYFSTKDGLAHNTVLSSFVDDFGFVWFGTMDGISRFDANGFTNYRRKDYPNLPSNFIHSISRWGKDSLLITTRDQGFALLLPDKNHFVPIRPKAGEISENQYSMVKSVEKWSSDKLLVYFSNEKWSLINVLTLEETPLNLTEEPGISEFGLLYKTSSGKWFLMSEEKVFSLDIQPGEKRIKPQLVLDISKTNHGKLMRLFEFESQFFLWTSRKGLFLIDEDKPKLNKPIPVQGIPLDRVRNVLKVNEGLFLLTDQAEFWRYSLKNKQVEHFDYQKNTLVEMQNVNSLAQDRFQTLWLSTWGSGAVQIVVNEAFKHVPKAQTFNRKENDFILGVLEDTYQTIWFSGNNALRRWYPKQQKMQFLDGLKTGSVWQMRESESGIWISTTDKGLFLLDNENVSSTKVNEKPQQFSKANGLVSNHISMTMKDSFGRFWLVHHFDGIEVYESEEAFLTSRKQKRMAFFTQSNNVKKFTLPDRSVRILYESTDGSIWGGTFSAGAVRLSDSEGNLSVYVPDATDGLMYPHKDIRGFYQDKNKPELLWMATYGGGLIKWNQIQKKTDWLQTEQGLSNNFTYGIIADSSGNIWIPTIRGLNRYHLESGLNRIFLDSDGLSNNEFNTMSYHYGKSGNLYFGGVDGLNFFQPEAFSEAEPLVNVKITSVKAYNRELMKPEFYEKGNKLSYQERFLNITYSGLDLSVPQNQTYKYRLVGSESSWIEAGNHTSTSFSNLTPGKYTFEVQVANSEGRWNPEADRFSFEIVPPFWMTWWFRLSASLVFILGFTWLIRLISTQKLNEELRRLETEQKIQHERERISKDLHDHVGNQLANILSGVDLIRKHVDHGNQQRALELYKNVKDDLKGTMQQLRETIWTLHQSEVTLKELALRLETYFRTRMTDTLSIIVDVDDTAQIEKIIFAPGKSLHIFRIIQEAVQNSIKYSDATQIQVRFWQSENLLWILVSDNGVFLERSSDYEGYGLKNMQHRAEEIGAVFSLGKGEQGTCVKLGYRLE